LLGFAATSLQSAPHCKSKGDKANVISKQ
jgi:hypothetical protein